MGFLNRLVCNILQSLKRNNGFNYSWRYIWIVSAPRGYIKFLIEGMSVLFGNDLAGGEFVAYYVFSVILHFNNECGAKNLGIFPTWAITREWSKNKMKIMQKIYHLPLNLLNTMRHVCLLRSKMSPELEICKIKKNCSLSKI